MKLWERNEEEKKRKRIRAYFTPRKPSSRDRKDRDWILEAYGAGIIKYGDITRKEKKWPRKGIEWEIKTEKFSEAKAERIKKMRLWEVTERDVSGKPTSREIDSWLESDLEDIKRDAFERGGIGADEPITEPVLIAVPLLQATPRIHSDDIILMADQNDGILRSSCYDIVLLVLDDRRINIFRSEYNMLRIQNFTLDTRHWWYDGIVSFGIIDVSSSESYKLLDGQTITTASVLQMRNKAGEKVEILIHSRDLRDIFDAELKLSFREANIRAIRDKIDEKKSR